MNDTMTTVAIEADPTVPIIHITRIFVATPAQLFRAHTDPELFVRWVGPNFPPWWVCASSARRRRGPARPRGRRR